MLLYERVLDVALVSLCHACFFLSLREGLSPSSLCYSISLCSQSRSGGIITEDTKTENDPGLNFSNSKIKFLLLT